MGRARGLRRLTTLATALTLVALTMTVPGPAQAATNDTPQTAQVIAPSTTQVDVPPSSSLSSPASGCFFNRPSAWYSLTPTRSYDLALVTGAKALDVYTGTPGNLTRRICNDDGGPFGAKDDSRTRLVMAVTSGTTYYIAVNNGSSAGFLSLADATYVADPATVEYAARSGTRSITLGGAMVPGQLHIVEQPRTSLLVRKADVMASLQSRLTLQSGDRTCPQRMGIGDGVVLNSSGLWATYDATLQPIFDRGGSCDPDGEMDGGTYQLRYAIRSDAGQPWSTRDLGSADVTGPGGVLRVVSTKASKNTVIDYPHLRDKSQLSSPVQEQWTDGSWRKVGAGTVARADLRIQVQPAGSAEWLSRALPLAASNYLSGTTVAVDFEPHQDGQYRLAAPGQSPASTSDAIDVIGALDQHSIEQLRTGRVRYIHETVVASSQAMVKFDDGQWRPNKSAPFRLEYQKKGTSKWTLIKTGTVRLDGDLSVRFQARPPGSYRVTVDGHSSRPVFLDTRRAPPSQIIMDAPYTIRLGDPFSVRGCLADRYDNCFSGKRLVLQYLSDGQWVTLDSGTTGSNGWVTLRVASGRLGTYRVLSPTTGLSDSVTYVAR